MTSDQVRKLDRLALYGTAYELALVHPDGRRFLVQYTSRKSRLGIVAAVAAFAKGIVAASGETQFKVPRPGREAVLGDWRVKFTGRTERDAIKEGELPRLPAVD